MSDTHVMSLASRPVCPLTSRSVLQGYVTGPECTTVGSSLDPGVCAPVGASGIRAKGHCMSAYLMERAKNLVFASTLLERIAQEKPPQETSKLPRLLEAKEFLPLQDVYYVLLLPQSSPQRERINRQ